ncbi:MAG: hypothetical protein ACK4VY_00740 [Brevundimonas sp.]
MATRRSTLTPALITALSVVVLLQSLILFWAVMAPPSDRDRVLQAIRETPGVGTVVEAGEAALT